MSDAAVTTIVSGFVTITLTVVGFLTLWIKLRYGEEQATKAAARAEEAAIKVNVVEKKLDNNTLITTAAKDEAKEAANQADSAIKAAGDANDVKVALLHKIEQQTNGTMDRLQVLVESVAIRVDKLETYNRDSSHRVLDAINSMHLKLAEMNAVQGMSSNTVPPTPVAGSKP